MELERGMLVLEIRIYTRLGKESRYRKCESGILLVLSRGCDLRQTFIGLIDYNATQMHLI